MRWTRIEPTVRPRDLEAVLAGMPLPDVVELTARLATSPLILMGRDARETIRRHVSARREESGGLLLGHVAVLSGKSSAHLQPMVSVVEAVPAESYEGTRVSLQMDSDVWAAALPKTEAGLLVVGWFHSHPNLGAFFSGTDRTTQRRFFRHEYSVGYVIDPVKDEHAYFLGEHSEEIPESRVVSVEGVTPWPPG